MDVKRGTYMKLVSIFKTKGWDPKKFGSVHGYISIKIYKKPPPPPPPVSPGPIRVDTF